MMPIPPLAAESCDHCAESSRGSFSNSHLPSRLCDSSTTTKSRVMHRPTALAILARCFAGSAARRAVAFQEQALKSPEYGPPRNSPSLSTALLAGGGEGSGDRLGSETNSSADCEFKRSCMLTLRRLHVCASLMIWRLRQSLQLEKVGSGRSGRCQWTNHAADPLDEVASQEKSSVAKLALLGEEISRVARWPSEQNPLPCARLYNQTTSSRVVSWTSIFPFH